MKVIQASLKAPGGETMTTWLDVRPDLKHGVDIELKDMPGTRWKVVKLYDGEHEATDFDWHRKWDNNI